MPKIKNPTNPKTSVKIKGKRKYSKSLNKSVEEFEKTILKENNINKQVKIIASIIVIGLLKVKK